MSRHRYRRRFGIYCCWRCYRFGYCSCFRGDDRCRHVNKRRLKFDRDRRHIRCRHGKPFLGHDLLRRRLHFGLSFTFAFGTFGKRRMFRLRRAFAALGWLDLFAATSAFG